MKGDFKLNYHLAPPALSAKNDKGELQKRQFGPWIQTAFKVLAPFKVLRGTPLDPFGRTEERQTERALIGQYRASIEEVLDKLSAGNHATAVEIARIPEMIKGYGHVKARHLATARPQWAALMTSFRQPEQVAELARA